MPYFCSRFALSPSDLRWIVPPNRNHSKPVSPRSGGQGQSVGGNFRVGSSTNIGSRAWLLRHRPWAASPAVS